MKFKKLLSISARVLFVVVSLFFVRFRYLFGQIWFSTIEDTPAIKVALERDSSDVNAYDPNGFTGLMLAASRSQQDTARVLLAYGADPNLRSKFLDPELKIIIGDSALHLAVYNGNISGMDGTSGSYGIIWDLVQYYADVNLPNLRGDRPLHYITLVGVMDKQRAIIQFLLDFGADLNAQNDEGNTMMHMIVQVENQTLIEELLRDYYSILDLSKKNNKGFDVIGWAHHLNLFDIEAVLKVKREVVGAGEYGQHVNDRGRNGMTALMFAVIRNDKPFVQRLLTYGAEVNAHANDQWHNTPLHYAVLHDRPEMAQLLLAHRASPAAKNRQGLTPLFFVIRLFQHLKLVKEDTQRAFDMANILIKGGADINTKNKDGFTVIQLAVSLKASDLALHLINTYRKTINFDSITNSYSTLKTLAEKMDDQAVLQAIAQKLPEK